MSDKGGQADMLREKAKMDCFVARAPRNDGGVSSVT
jgi:hypothetical protein